MLESFCVLALHATGIFREHKFAHCKFRSSQEVGLPNLLDEIPGCQT